jgi:ATP synthase subunit 6
MLRQQVGDLGKKYYIIIFSIFFLIISSNLLGMLPFGFTLTAHLSLTFFLAFSVNLGLIVLGFYKNKFNFLLLFVPKGAPLFLMPLIVVIEVVSYLIRTFSLSIRLFANMMAGHCPLFVISMFIFILVDFYSHLVMFPIFMIYVLIFILEFAIAVLQAYVFTILVCIYLNDSLHPVH